KKGDRGGEFEKVCRGAKGRGGGGEGWGTLKARGEKGHQQLGRLPQGVPQASAAEVGRRAWCVRGRQRSCRSQGLLASARARPRALLHLTATRLRRRGPRRPADEALCGLDGCWQGWRGWRCWWPSCSPS